ncbi:DUF2383 domain-containing protein [uncultured Polaribacter sp.]|uniref:DUF2383 domain-containing protein n=1 Tax=uncultured Polaribacter sp. TaxID=174711 RepID=UPI0026121B5A|nr:DUF2383 domain-containing protein [uncultured Polaribacter sp.]
MKGEELFSKLDCILENSIDSELGYYKIAKNTTNPLIQSISNLKYSERNNYTLELKQCFLQINAVPVRQSSKNRREISRWVNPKSILNTTGLTMVIDEIIESEKNSLKDYNDILNRKDLPLRLRDTLETQKSAILNGIVKLRLRKES